MKNIIEEQGKQIAELKKQTPQQPPQMQMMGPAEATLTHIRWKASAAVISNSINTGISTAI